MPLPTKTSTSEDKKLARKTIQIVGLVFAVALTIFKLASPDSDIPWWVIFGFFGASTGATSNINFDKIVGKK